MSRLPAVLQKQAFKVIGSPLFIISNPKLVIAQCINGVIGSMPALNARPASQLDEWLAEITEALAAHDRAHPDRPAAPFAINQIVHKSNDRLEHDMALCVKYKVPVIITSLPHPDALDATVAALVGARVKPRIVVEASMAMPMSGFSRMRWRRVPLCRRRSLPSVTASPLAGNLPPTKAAASAKLWPRVNTATTASPPEGESR